MRRAWLLCVVVLVGVVGGGVLGVERTSAGPQHGVPPASLRARLEALIGGSGAEVAVGFATLDGRETVMINEEVVFHAASTMKVPVMVELFRQAAAGTLSLDDRITVTNRFTSVVDGTPYSLSAGDDSEEELYRAVGSSRTCRELCEAMITVSSNLAANILIERLGAARINETMRGYGAGGMVVLRGVEDGKAFAQGLNNTTTARGFLAILLAIGRREAVSASASAEMLEILERQKFRDGIPAGLPPGIAVGHKTGTITKVHHDGGIVLAARPYALVVLTRGLADEKTSDALIARISRTVYDWLAGRAKRPGSTGR